MDISWCFCGYTTLGQVFDWVSHLFNIGTDLWFVLFTEMPDWARAVLVASLLSTPIILLITQCCQGSILSSPLKAGWLYFGLFKLVPKGKLGSDMQVSPQDGTDATEDS